MGKGSFRRKQVLKKRVQESELWTGMADRNMILSSPGLPVGCVHLCLGMKEGAWYRSALTAALYSRLGKLLLYLSIKAVEFRFQ